LAFAHCCGAPPRLHPFPTRRSSDLERDDLRQIIARGHKELQRLVATGKATADVTGHIADLHTRLAADEHRLPDLDARLTEMEKRSEEHTSELQSREHLECRLRLEKK